MNLTHLEQRMRQSGHWNNDEPLGRDAFREMLTCKISDLDVRQAREEVAPFVKDPKALFGLGSFLPQSWNGLKSAEWRLFLKP